MAFNIKKEETMPRKNKTANEKPRLKDWKSYDDIKPNGRLSFSMSYYHALRELRKVQIKLERMCARFKAEEDELRRPERK
jgi:hypothetical protein